MATFGTERIYNAIAPEVHSPTALWWNWYTLKIHYPIEMRVRIWTVIGHFKRIVVKRDTRRCAGHGFGCRLLI